MIVCMTFNAVHRRLLTLDQVAERLQLSRRTVERHLAAGEIPALQLGGPRTAVRVDESELEAWLYAVEPSLSAESPGPTQPPQGRDS